MDKLKIEEVLSKLRKSPYVEEFKPENEFVLAFFRGKGGKVSKKWNVKIYVNKESEPTKIVTNDWVTLKRIISGAINEEVEKEKVIFIDDAGVGFPVGGVVLGVYEEPSKRFLFKRIPVKYFQGEYWKQKKYLEFAAEKVNEMITQLKASPEDTKIVICPGNIHRKTKLKLRKEGFHVEIDEIKDPLQSLIEEKFRSYLVSEFNVPENLFFDPKLQDPRKGFRKVIKWLKEKPERMKFAKTGWKYFNKFSREGYGKERSITW